MRNVCLIWLAILAVPALAEVVQLVSPGETVVTLQPGATRALVRETRPLQMPAGPGSVSFSWDAAGLDSGSVTLNLEGGTVGEVVRPAGQERTLVWQVNMPQAGQVPAVITYFLDGFKWQPEYVLNLLPEGKAELEGSLRLTNETGVALEGVRVQVGAPGALLADRAQPTGEALAATLDVAAGQTGGARFAYVADLPATCRLVYQADRYGGNVERILRLGLDEAGVPAAQMPTGPMLIQQAADPRVPVFKTQLAYQPGQEFEVDMGPEPDVVVERKLVGLRRGNLDLDRFGRVAGLDTTEEIKLIARNHLDQPVTLEVIETVLSTWDLKGTEPVRRETSWVQFDLPVPAGGRAELIFTLVKHSGTRAKK